MSAPVFLVPADTLQLGVVRVAGDEGHHAAKVKRIREGEVVDICDGAGSRASASVSAIGKDWIEVAVEHITRESEPDVRFVVVQAIAKGDRADLALELLTEVGVSRVIPWQAAHSVAKWDTDKSHTKWERVVREATKQSRRSRVPVIDSPVTTQQLCALISSAPLAIVLHESADMPLAAVTLPPQGDVLIVVGPEGGISPDEVTACAAAGAHVVRMGSTVMRTSTAGGVALGILASKTWN